MAEPTPLASSDGSVVQLSHVSSDGSMRADDTKVNTPELQSPTLQHSDPNEIQYFDLTFDIDFPTIPFVPETVKTDIPPCPNLRKYDNPYDWPQSRKTIMTCLCCAVNGIAAYASGAYASPEFQLTRKWGISHAAFSCGFTVFTTGFGIAPMVLAPFSEIQGRRPVFIATGVLFLISQVGCAVTDSFAGMLLARFFQGVGGSTFSTMVGGILADIWMAEDRNTAYVCFTGTTLFGTGVGPLISGYVAENLLWRWVFIIQIIFNTVLIGLVAICFKETRGSIILSKKAKAINAWYEKLEEAGALGMKLPSTHEHHIDLEKLPETSLPTPPYQRIRYQVAADRERATLGTMILLSLYRPIHLLFTEPVVFFFSLWISFSWSILYLQFGSVPLVFSTSYNFTLSQTGYVFTAMCVGAIISTVLSIYQEKWATKKYPDKMIGNPEGRLLFTCIESAFVPIGLFWFGWTCFPTVHWIVPAIAVGVATMGIFSVFLAVFNYTADVYNIYASSALAASGLCRNLLAGGFVLVTRPLFVNLGFQRASSLLGGIAALLTLVPWVLVAFGPKIRARSKIASSFVREGG